jgi:hypothetical protein
MHFADKNIALKLFWSFYRSIEPYSQGETYAHVLKLFFSQFCKNVCSIPSSNNKQNHNEN